MGIDDRRRISGGMFFDFRRVVSVGVVCSDGSQIHGVRLFVFGRDFGLTEFARLPLVSRFRLAAGGVS